MWDAALLPANLVPDNPGELMVNLNVQMLNAKGGPDSRPDHAAVVTLFDQLLDQGVKAALEQQLDGRLLEPELLGEMTREHACGEDRTLLTATRLGLGCMLDQPDVANATYGLGPKAFGHPGAGGSVGFADPDPDVAFGFVTNSLGPYVLMDPRAQKLARTLGRCL